MHHAAWQQQYAAWLLLAAAGCCMLLAAAGCWLLLLRAWTGMHEPACMPLQQQLLLLRVR